MVTLFSSWLPVMANPSNLVFVARTGTNGITVIKPNVTVNREGVIAFTGNDAAGSRPFWVSYPFNITPMGVTAANRTYSGVGISGGGNPLKPDEVQNIAQAFLALANMDRDFTDQATEGINHKPSAVGLAETANASS